MIDKPQYIVTLDDAGTELLITFWNGTSEPPEVAPRLDANRWGLPFPIRRVDA